MTDLPRSRFSISFVDVPTTVLPHTQDSLISWLDALSGVYEKAIGNLHYHLCSDEHLLELNKQHLDHHDLTDILTFPYSYSPIEAEVFISTDRARDNATSLGVGYEEELLRLFAHGFLHMSGFDDKGEEDKSRMRTAEDNCIKLYFTHE
ncbi:MAG: rRNA maturation RNase YbeY [Saprospiraceae bacterium]|nr:rRNA maturation RNase YbeY [Saprospiraceae bacterium]